MKFPSISSKCIRTEFRVVLRVADDVQNCTGRDCPSCVHRQRIEYWRKWLQLWRQRRVISHLQQLVACLSYLISDLTSQRCRYTWICQRRFSPQCPFQIQCRRCVGRVFVRLMKLEMRGKAQRIASSAPQYRPLANSSEPKPCYHLANVQRMHVVPVCLHYSQIWHGQKLVHLVEYLRTYWTDFRNLFTIWKRSTCRWWICTSFFKF